MRFIEGVAAASTLPVLEKRMLKEQGRSLSLLDKFHYLTGVFYIFFKFYEEKNKKNTKQLGEVELSSGCC